jgi:DNA-directed RNA polymerase specialized sigma24 family protein
VTSRQGRSAAAEPSATTSAATPQAPQPRDPLAALSKAQWAELFELAYSVALAITKSKPRSDDLVQTTFERLLTTRSWDGMKPIEVHVIGIVKSLISNQHKSKTSKRSAEAHEGFHREVIGTDSPSPEDKTIEYAADAKRQSDASTELEELSTRVSAHPLAQRVLQRRIEGLSKAADIAHALGVSVDEVYRANDVLRRNLRALRKSRGDDNDEEES